MWCQEEEEEEEEEGEVVLPRQSLLSLTDLVCFVSTNFFSP
jgi:hypothetical protein